MARTKMYWTASHLLPKSKTASTTRAASLTISAVKSRRGMNYALTLVHQEEEDQVVSEGVEEEGKIELLKKDATWIHLVRWEMKMAIEDEDEGVEGAEDEEEADIVEDLEAVHRH
jgi:hypothetical protein